MKRRQQRVQVAIQRIISQAFQAEGLAPDAWKISVTRVAVSANLRFARVYFSSLDGEAGRDAARELVAGSRKHLKRFLAANLRLKYQPELDFAWDEDLFEAENVDRLIAEIKEQEQEKEQAGKQEGEE